MNIPIRRSANRPILFLGGDREIGMMTALVAVTLVWIGQSFLSVTFGIALFAFSNWILKKAAKADPYMRQVYLRSQRYKSTYLARSTPFVDMSFKRNGNLKRYRSNQPGVCDLLNYAALVDDGIVLNKDGSLMAGWRYTGEDEASRTPEEQALVAYRINKALKRLGNGWVLHDSASRREAAGYSPRGLSHFPNRITAALDEERRRFFEKRGQTYESDFALVVTWYPPLLAEKKLVDMMFDDDSKQGGGRDQTHELIEQFKRGISNIEHSLSPQTFKMQRLAGVAKVQEDGQTVIYDELLAHLQFCITGEVRPVRVPDQPIYMDAFLGGCDLVTGVIPKVGRKFVQVVCIEGFPDSSRPGILNSLAEMSMEYRWTNRFVFLDREESKALLDKYRKKWGQKIRGFFSQLMNNANAAINKNALDMRDDAVEAIAEIESGDAAGGFYTGAIVLMDEDRSVVEAAAKQVEKAINNLGFVARLESLNTVEAYFGSLPGHGQPNLRRPYINTFNLAHLLPTSTIWTGENKAPHPYYPPLSPPLMHCVTKGNTPFRLNFHIRELGHTMIFGPTRAGKSTFLNLSIAQFFRYAGMHVWSFDKGRSIFPLCKAAGGDHYTIGGENQALQFCPLQFLESAADKAWAVAWIETILELNNVAVTPKQRNEISGAIANMAQSAEDRSLTHFKASVQDDTIRQALHQYTVEGTMGYLFDSLRDSLALSRFNVFECEELLRLDDKYVIPLLDYFFRRIEAKIDSLCGAPSMITIDEAWMMLAHPVFRPKLVGWFKTLAKKKCLLVLATQSLSDAGNSGILDVITESTATQVFLPNAHAKQFAELYKRMGLNDCQIDIVAAATPQRDYYVVSEKGRRAFSLELGPLALAIVGSTSPDDLAKVEEHLKKYGPESWLEPYLRSKGIELSAYEERKAS